MAFIALYIWKTSKVAACTHCMCFSVNIILISCAKVNRYLNVDKIQHILYAYIFRFLPALYAGFKSFLVFKYYQIYDASLKLMSVLPVPSLSEKQLSLRPVLYKLKFYLFINCQSHQNQDTYKIK